MTTNGNLGPTVDRLTRERDAALEYVLRAATLVGAKVTGAANIGEVMLCRVEQILDENDRLRKDYDRVVIAARLDREKHMSAAHVSQENQR